MPIEPGTGPINPPGSAWVRDHARLIPGGGRVLDLAAGSGRHARLFKGLGHRVTALDKEIGGLADLTGDSGVEIIQADLEDGSRWPLAGRLFAGIVVVNYLHRPILKLLATALAPGGVLIYETFGAGNERFGRPTNPNFLLRPGELLELAEGAGLIVHAYRCAEIVDERQAVRQGMVARKPFEYAVKPPVEFPR